MFVFPTRDIHLVAAPGLNDPIHLSLFAEILAGTPPAPVWTNLAMIPNVVIVAVTTQQSHAIMHGRSNPPVVSDSPTGLSFAPGTAGFGTDFFLASVSGSGLQFPVRVTVHPDITRLFLAQSTVTLLQGENNVVLSVFGEFPDPGGVAIWDISEHTYLEFSSSKTAVADVDATGRIRAIAPGNATVSVQVRGRPATARSCTVTVETVAARLGRGNITKKILQAPRGAKHSIFILSEGYADAAVFKQQSEEIVDNWMRREANSPFRWVKDQFKVTAIFDQAADRGIAVGPVFAALANRNSQPQTPAAINMITGGLAYQPARDTRFGLMYGARLGDPNTPDFDTHRPTADQWLSPNLPDRAITVDHRKLPPVRDMTQSPPVTFDPREQFKKFLDRYFAALGITVDPEDRVVFLVDDQFRGGARLPVAGAEPRPNYRVAMTTASDTLGFDNWQRTPNQPFVTRSPQRRAFHGGWVASSVVHEIGHTYGLGDEYEPRRQAILPATATAAQIASARLVLERFDNLELRNDVFDGTNVDVTRIKWFVNRVKKGSRVLSLAPAGVNFAATVGADPSSVWSVNEDAILRTTFVRARALPPNPALPRLLEFQVTVKAVTKTTVDLAVPAGFPIAEFATGGLLYAPQKQTNGRDLKLIDPNVVQFLTVGNTVFPKPPAGSGSDPCADPTPGRNEDEVTPPTIAGFTPPTRAADLVGLYEGGGEFACGVVRPTGRCKLRRAAVFDERSQSVKEVWPFCFVCKFVITDHIDGGQHAQLDKEYP